MILWGRYHGILWPTMSFLVEFCVFSGIEIDLKLLQRGLQKNQGNQFSVKHTVDTLKLFRVYLLSKWLNLF